MRALTTTALALAALTLAGCAQVLMVTVGGAGMTFWGMDFGSPEGWLRLLASVALFCHPWHEQRLGFRRAFNSRVHEGRSEWYEDWPLSRRQNAAQATLLATVFPALALWGPWWALAGLLSFYALDQAWTHAHERIPGFLSATAAMWVLMATYWFAIPDRLSGRGVILSLVAAAAGFLLLSLPWWMAYRKVGA